MDDRPIVLDIKDVKKKYVIKQNIEKPKTQSGKFKLTDNKIFHRSKK